MKPLDAVSIGACYVDTNFADYPFESVGIPTETELVGGPYETVAGGSAVNFCRLLAELGLKTAFIGMAGTDPNGDNLERLLQQDGIESLLVRQPDLLTNIGTNMTNPAGEHIMLVAGTANAALSPAAVLPRLTDVIGKTQTLYLGGCFKLKSLAPAFTEIAGTARRNQVTMVVDHGRIPQGADPEMLTAVKQLVLQAAYYLPSRAEFCQLWGAASIEEGLRALHDMAGGLNIIVKDGAAGAYYWDDGSLHHVPAQKVATVVQVTGAGDSFNAGVIAAISRGLPIPKAAAYGCAVAAAKIAGSPIPRL